MAQPVEKQPLAGWQERSDDELLARARAFRTEMALRRTVRDFSPRPVPREVIEQCLLTAGSAPSGANQQPWFFAVITQAEHKRRVREAAKAEERAFYAGRAPGEWLEALAALHGAGLATLTHTPSPMGFLSTLCGRPENERPVVLLVAGHPAPGCQVPVAGGVKKPLQAIAQWL